MSAPCRFDIQILMCVQVCERRVVCVSAHKHAVTFKNNHMGKKQVEEPKDKLAFDLSPSPGPVLGPLTPS